MFARFLAMGKINRLPTDLANQIAAGEVVERPASVVKELVENAIDAGARRLAIHVELGGKKQIRVEDDGEGMAPDDARLAIERHATSKLRCAEDLAAILTLGFRGEALPSIASVSHFMLRTRARGQQSGTEIRVNGGALASIVEAGAPEGTVVEVNDLFYNLPARRKFLKSDGAESAQISRVVTQLALAYPEVGFTLTSAGRKVLQCPPAVSQRDRLYQVSGERSDLLELRKDAGGLKLTGFVAALAEQGPTRGPQNVFINRRIVKDKTIAHAIIDSYSQASIKERSPEVHLFIEMPADALDVNVHPTKAEVRFRDQSLVHEVVRRALMETLGQSGAPQLQLRPEHAAQAPFAPALPGVLAGGQYPNRWMPTYGAGQAAEERPAGDASTNATDAMDGAYVGHRFSGAGGAGRDRHQTDDSARPVPRHLHHRRGRRGDRDHRSARRPRARAVRARDGDADGGTARIAAAAACRCSSTSRRRRIRRCSRAPESSSVSASKSRASAAPRSR